MRPAGAAGHRRSVTDLAEAADFLASLGEGGAVMVKAVAGGGGRGMRPVSRPDELEEALARCRSEAEAAFGDGAVYVERMVTGARHVEVQIVGDGSGAVSHLHTRDCSLQRRRQKLIEIAPAPHLSDGLRDRLQAAAVRLGRGACATRRSARSSSWSTSTARSPRPGFAFMEANARLQVEHTVTEEITGIDLVQTQLRLAGGAAWPSWASTQADIPAPRGFAVQARVNAETLQRDGTTTPSGGVIDVFELPSGPGIRVDGTGFAGYRLNPRYDSLLAKVIASSPSHEPGASLAADGAGAHRAAGRRGDHQRGAALGCSGAAGGGRRRWRARRSWTTTSRSWRLAGPEVGDGPDRLATS